MKSEKTKPLEIFWSTPIPEDCTKGLSIWPFDPHSVEDLNALLVSPHMSSGYRIVPFAYGLAVVSVVGMDFLYPQALTIQGFLDFYIRQYSEPHGKVIHHNPPLSYLPPQREYIYER